MAINPVVFYSPDRALRITVDANNTTYRVERNLVFVAEFTNPADLAAWLGNQGIDIADLIED